MNRKVTILQKKDGATKLKKVNHVNNSSMADTDVLIENITNVVIARNKGVENVKKSSKTTIVKSRVLTRLI